MTKANKASQLRSQLANLDNALTPTPTRGIAQPVAAKVVEGGDRVFGEN